MSELLIYLSNHLPQDEYQKVLSTARPAVNYTLAPADGLPLKASKMGGIGYWDKGVPYLTNDKGKPFALLAQINLDDIDDGALVVMGLPTTGILAFYIDPYMSGSSYENFLAKKAGRCVYFADMSKPSLSRDEQMAMFGQGAFYQELDDELDDDESELDIQTVRPLVQAFVADYDKFLVEFGDEKAYELWQTEKIALTDCDDIVDLTDQLIMMGVMGSGKALLFDLKLQLNPLQTLTTNLMKARLGGSSSAKSNRDDDWLHPVNGEYAMSFVPTTHYLINESDEFEHHYGQRRYLWAENFGLDDDELDEFIIKEQGHYDHLGGYATFVQCDPRDDEMADDKDAVLLFQNGGGADETIDILWGDAGIGHFLIDPKDLQARRFDKAWHWCDH